MKKPVRPTGEALEAIIAKRVNKLITVRKSLVSGHLGDITRQVADFAVKEQVATTEVKINSSYYGAELTVRRRETDAEKAKRVRQEVNMAYGQKKWAYDRWLERQHQEIAEAQRTLAKANVTLTCNCRCTCCKEN